MIYHIFTNSSSLSTYWLSSKNRLFGCGKSSEYRFGLKNNKSNYEQFGENELMYDPNKVQPKPEDNDIFYE